MAPYLSLLPVRKSKPPPSALPRPTSSHSTNNHQSLPPLQPHNPTQATADPDQSLLDFVSLLGGQQEEDQSFGLLNDQEVPDFLADESMWTVGGRTPAKKGMQVLAELDEEDEEEEQEELISKGIARYDDSEDDIRQSPPPTAANVTLSPNSNSTSSFPRPASTPSFRQSPAHQGRALFDEEEPSMAMGNYSSNSNRSKSFARDEDERDSTFTFDREQHVVPEESTSAVNEVAEAVSAGEEECSEAHEGELSETRTFEREVNETMANGDLVSSAPQVTEDKEHVQEALMERVGDTGNEEEMQEEEKVEQDYENSVDQGGEGSVEQEHEYSDPPEETLQDLIEEAGLELGMVEENGQNAEDRNEDDEAGECGIQGNMDEMVPVKFSADADSIEGQDNEMEEEEIVEPIAEIAPPVESLSAALPSPPLERPRKRSSLAPLPQTTIPVSVEDQPIPFKVRPRPSFTSAPLPTKRARHSIAASRPAHILPPDHPAHRRRQSVATVGNYKQEGKGKGNEKAKKPGSNEGDAEEEGAPAEESGLSGPEERSNPIEQSEASTSARSSSPQLATIPLNPDLPPAVSNSCLCLDSDVAESSTTTTTVEQPVSNSLFTLPSKVTTPPPQADSSLPLSPESHEPASFEGDLTLPMMGAPLSFNPCSLETGHSTPAKTRAPSSMVIEEEEEGMGRRNGMKLGGLAIETIEEVTEEESSFEILRERSAAGEVESEMQVKEEEHEDGEVCMEEEVEESVIQQQQALDYRPSSAVPLTRSSSESLLQSEVALAQSATLDPAPSADLDPIPSLPSPERPPRRAARISLAPTLPVEPVPEAPIIEPTPSSITSAFPSESSQPQPILKKRSVRVSLAAPPSQPVRTKTARRASTSAITSTSTLSASMSRREREGRPIRVSLAPPPQSTSAAKRRSSVQLDSVPATIAVETTLGTESIPQDRVEPPTQPVETATPTQEYAIEIATPANLDTNLQDEKEESHLPPVASTSQVPLPSTSPHAIPAPLPASATSSKHATLTLPTTFSFASTSNSLTREQERQRRKEERERREKRVEAALKAKKQGAQRGTGWKKPETKSARESKGKGKEIERENKRPRLATSSNGSTRSRPAAGHASKPSSISQDPPQSSEPHRPLPPPVPSITPSVVTDIEAPTQSMSAPVLKLTKATLEANRVAAGPRIDLKRRVSTFLEGIEEESRGSASMACEESTGEPLESEPEVQQEVQEEEPLYQELTGTGEDLVDCPTTTGAPPAPPAPPPPPVVSRPVSRNATRPVTLKTSSSRLISAAPKRRAPPVKTTAAKPFTFAAPRPRPAPAAPSSNAGTASPMFVERLSSWKAREQETIGKGKRKAPPPMPFKTQDVQPTRLAPSTTTSSSAPAVKRPRVAPPVAEQGRKGKENAPSQRPVAAQKQKPVGKPVMICGGVAEEMEKRMKEKLEWSERQKKREEEVKRRREEAQMTEADRERQKLQALRSSLSTDRRSTAAAQAAAPPRGRPNPVGRV